MRICFKINVKIKPNIKFQNQCYQRGAIQNNQLLGNQSKSIIFLTTDIDCNQYSVLRELQPSKQGGKCSVSTPWHSQPKTVAIAHLSESDQTTWQEMIAEIVLPICEQKLFIWCRPETCSQTWELFPRTVQIFIWNFHGVDLLNSSFVGITLEPRLSKERRYKTLFRLFCWNSLEWQNAMWDELARKPTANYDFTNHYELIRLNVASATGVSAPSKHVWPEVLWAFELNRISEPELSKETVGENKHVSEIMLKHLGKNDVDILLSWTLQTCWPTILWSLIELKFCVVAALNPTP